MKHVNAEWGKQNIDLRYMKILEMSLMSSNVDDLKIQLNELDGTITNILTNAEQHCTNFSTHQLDTWAPELIAALKNRRYWWTKLTQAQKLPNKIGLV